jgi:hypothetical protein
MPGKMGISIFCFLLLREVIKRRLKRFDLAERKAARPPKFKDYIQNWN